MDEVIFCSLNDMDQLLNGRPPPELMRHSGKNVQIHVIHGVKNDRRKGGLMMVRSRLSGGNANCLHHGLTQTITRRTECLRRGIVGITVAIETTGCLAGLETQQRRGEIG
jgi:hypothetical protein